MHHLSKFNERDPNLDNPAETVEEGQQESAALIANDLRVLVSELNEKMAQAAQRGLIVRVSAGFSLSPIIAQHLSISITAEVK